MAARRDLTFSSLDQVMPDVDRLLAGHTTIRTWSLGQICNHLSGAISGSVTGFEGKAPWLIRKFVGPVVMRGIIKKGKMREGFKLPDEFLPKPGLDARAEAEALREAIARFIAYTGPTPDHPFAGPLSREGWEKLHLIHTAHHLSFVLPV